MGDLRDQDPTIAEAFNLLALLSVASDPSRIDACRSFLGGLGYAREALDRVPNEAIEAAIGCGVPAAHVALHRGSVVLDLGCGSGLDLLLAANEVGVEGMAIGVDISVAMVAKARAAAAAADANVQVIVADMLALPFAAGSVDVVISNASLNLASDRAAAAREAFRVLRPGGSISICEVVSENQFPDELRSAFAQWGSWVGAVGEVSEYVSLLRAAGFVAVNFSRSAERERSIPLSSVALTARKPWNRQASNDEGDHHVRSSA